MAEVLSLIGPSPAAPGSQIFNPDLTFDSDKKSIFPFGRFRARDEHSPTWSIGKPIRKPQSRRSFERDFRVTCEKMHEQRVL